VIFLSNEIINAARLGWNLLKIVGKKVEERLPT
jgi:hypothetical protein